jgi:phosphoesterase RecJ-like protein
MNLTEKFHLAYDKIRTARRVLIVGHVSPDADAMASVGALVEISRTAGVADIYAYVSSKPADAFDFIPNEGSVSSAPPADLKIFDLIVVLDCGSLSRTALAKPITDLLGRDRRPYIIEFDHHQPQDAYADLAIRLPDQASTTEIIYHFLRANDLKVTKSLANCIFIGLITDTGHFFYANSSRTALAVASEMLLCGASLPRIINHTVNNKNLASLKVWGRVLDNMRFNPTTGLIVSALTAEELADLAAADGRGANFDLFGGIASFLCTLSGVRVALLLREEGHKVKGSLRTNDDDIDVARIANSFGGGGHKKAAGFSVAGRLTRTETGWGVKKV